MKPKTLSDFQSWHGESSLFFNRKNAFFCDTSYSKHLKTRQEQESKLKSLNDKFSQLETQSTSKKLASLALKTHEKWVKIKKDLMSDHEYQEHLLHSSAICIQRHVRGFLTRLQTSLQILSLRELRTDFLIQESLKTAKVCFFHLGDLVESAAKTIQRAVKRYLLRVKLYRLIRTYYVFLEAKSKKASDVIRRFLLKFACNEKIESILFEKNREARLVQIKENLAVLKVKKFWKAKKLNFRILKDKILRMKRRKTALLNKEKFAKMMTTSVKSDKSPIMRSLTRSLSVEYSDEDETELPENAEERQKALNELERLKKEKEEALKVFKEKVSICKKAYGVKDLKETVILPFLQERELSEVVTNSLEVRLFETTASSAQKRIFFERTQLPQIRNTQISSPAKVWTKGAIVQSSSLPPLLITENKYTSKETTRHVSVQNDEFSVIFHKSPCKRHLDSGLHSFQPNPHRRHSVLRNQFLNKGTVANMMKKEEKKNKPYTGKIWKMGRRYSEYVTGLDNASFERKPWKPLRLDKSILETNASTQFASGNIKMHLRINSDPTSNFSLLSN
jgi:hypothetical protein